MEIAAQPGRDLLSRFCGAPGKLARRALSIAYFRRVQEQHRGRRGFVIGNGPSLRMEDLDRLRGEICIASNKIYLAFEHTRWRPDFHTMLDPLVVQKIGGVIGGHFQVTHTAEGLARFVRGCRVYTFRPLGAADRDPAEVVQFSDDLCRGAYSGWTVTFENLQLAHHLGLDPVYLIGCDHYYQGESGAGANQLVSHQGQQNHFAPNYRAQGEVVYAAPVAEMTRTYGHVRAFAERTGWQVRNATRGGHLEVFPRVEFDALFS